MRKDRRTLLWILLVLLTVFLLIINMQIHLQIGKEREYGRQISLGVKYLREKDYENAELCYKKALKIQDKRKLAYKGLAVAYEGQGKEEEALEIIKASEKIIKPEKVDTSAQKDDRADINPVNPDSGDSIPDDQNSGGQDSDVPNSDVSNSDVPNSDVPNSGNPNPEEPDSVEEEPWKAAYLPYIQDWRKVPHMAEDLMLQELSKVGGQGNDYNHFCSHLHPDESLECDSYGLIDLDSNHIPELFLNFKMAQMCAILTYSNESESVIYLGTYYNAFIDNNGEIIEEGHYSGEELLNDFYVYTINNGENISRDRLFYDLADSYGIIRHYSDDGNSTVISEKEYWKELWKKKMTGKYLYGIVLNKLEDESYLWNYKTQDLLPFKSQNKKWGYISTDKEWAIKAQYDAVSSFGEDSPDMAVVIQNGKKGCINRDGEEIIPVIYDEITVNSWGTVNAVKDGKNKYFDLGGEEIICPNNQKNASFSNGSYIFEENGKYGIDFKWGKIEPIYEWIGNMDRGIVSAVRDSKYGYITYEGEIIPCVYEDAHSFIQGKAAVSMNGKWGYINEYNEELIPFQYDFASDMYGDMAVVKSGEKWACIDSEGTEIVPMGLYDEIIPSDLGQSTIVVKKDGKYGLIDWNGQEILPAEWDEISCLSCDGFEMEVVRKGDKFGLYSSDGTERLPCRYDEISNLHSTNEYGDVVLVVQKDRSGYMNCSGEWIMEEEKAEQRRK